MRLIDADALKAKLKIDTNTATYSDYCNGYCDARQFDLYAIDAAPTIEPKVRHGRWEIIDKNANVWQCTTCGEEWMLNDGNPSDNYMLFCPHCGARMDGGADNG